jgi:YbbR domain-containing protein
MGSIVRGIQETVALFADALRTALRSLSENRGLAAVSVVLAFGTWIIVTDADNPTRERVLPVDIPVQPVNVPSDVALADELQPVRVRVKVEEEVFDSLTEADFEATVDLEGLTVGEYELPVSVRPLTSRGGLRIEDVLPERIQVRLAQLTGKLVPVAIEVKGEPPNGYSVETPEIAEEEVFVTGPQERVDQVTQATGEIDIAGRTDSIEQAVRLSARDNRGNLVQGVNLEPNVTEVKIGVEEQKFTRTVAVSPELSGVPAAGYNVTGVSVSPQTVTIRGDEAFVQGTISIPTKPVSIDGESEDVVRTVSLDLPSGVEVAGGVSVVTVTVKLSPAQGTVEIGTAISPTGLDSGLAIAGTLPPVTLTLNGDLAQLRQLTASDVSATINLSGKAAGVHRVPVQGRAPDGVVVQGVAPAEIDVTLESN